MKIGCVLSGGGMRGAYQAGVMKALAEHNLAPQIYSGTSIGALNALFCSCRGPASLAEFWTHTIKFSTLFRVRLFAFVLRLLAFLILPFHAISALIETGAFKSRSLARRVTENYHGDAILHFPRIPNVRGLTWLTILFTLFPCLFFVHPTDPTLTQGKSLAYVIWLTGLVEITICSGVLCAFFLFIAPRIWRFLERLDISFLVINEDHIFRSFIGSEAIIGKPVFCTVAEPTLMFDYRDTACYEILGPFGIKMYSSIDMFMSALTGLAEITCRRRHLFLPKYLLLPVGNALNALKTAMASAALPLGILPSGRVDGKQYVDGGLADNLPIKPLANLDLDVIVVVDVGKSRRRRASTKRSDPLHVLADHVREISRLSRLNAANQDAVIDRCHQIFREVLQANGELLKKRQFNKIVENQLGFKAVHEVLDRDFMDNEKLNARIIYIAPSKPIHAWWTLIVVGRSRVQEWVNLGYVDALATISREHLCDA